MAQADPTKAKPLQDIRVLLVEDDDDTRDLLEMVLVKAGAEVSAVACYEEALKELKRKRISLLLTDIGMPGYDGYALIAKVRSLDASEGGGPIPAVAITAFATIQDRHLASQSGFQAYLSKPFDPAEVIRVVAREAERPRKQLS